MPEIDLDFGGVGQVPEGWFRLTCDKAVYKQNKNKDGWIINLQMHFTDMPEGNLPGTEMPYESFENNMVYDNPSLKPNSRWKLKRILEAFTGENFEEDGMKVSYTCSVDCDEFEDTGKCQHEWVVPMLQGETVVALIKGEDYEGRTLARVEKYIYDDGSTEFGPNMTE